MKVLLINGSPRSNGCTHRALSEVEKVLNQQGIETKIIQVGHLELRGCIACNQCRNLKQCIFNDIVNEVSIEFEQSDGIIIGSPVYYASPNGTLLSFLDRLFYSTSFDKTMKVGAAIVSARRAGTTSSFEVLNKYFSISSMPIVTSQYWNNVHGNNAEELEQDKEGLQIMRTLGYNMAFLLKAIQLGKQQIGLPQKENKVHTNYIR